ncbi:protein of unknown function [Candidatus Filomicrobium marinum]|uniref:Uncharacterized protein n=1 Tax=Candidatus Filomicrobium marinum TaxID=1608628 RepID=A0A0D6JGS0_9HYPH|nr:protein of unknown function [Candidatus Filomicrobium marinum]CPR19705.1 protein of unknown function [Candidatus Filomicrobium marinum]
MIFNTLVGDPRKYACVGYGRIRPAHVIGSPLGGDAQFGRFFAQRLNNFLCVGEALSHFSDTSLASTSSAVIVARILGNWQSSGPAEFMAEFSLCALPSFEGSYVHQCA